MAIYYEVLVLLVVSGFRWPSREYYLNSHWIHTDDVFASANQANKLREKKMISVLCVA